MLKAPVKIFDMVKNVLFVWAINSFMTEVPII